MAPDHIEDHLETERVHAGHEPIEILVRPEAGVYRPVVADVVAEIPHGRGKERRDPNAIDAKARDIIQLLGNAREIADAVAVAVPETARVDVVDDGTLPPRVRHVRQPNEHTSSRPPPSQSI